MISVISKCTFSYAKRSVLNLRSTLHLRKHCIPEPWLRKQPLFWIRFPPPPPHFFCCWSRWHWELLIRAILLEAEKKNDNNKKTHTPRNNFPREWLTKCIILTIQVGVFTGLYAFDHMMSFSSESSFHLKVTINRYWLLIYILILSTSMVFLYIGLENSVIFTNNQKHLSSQYHIYCQCQKQSNNEIKMKSSLYPKKIACTVT